MVKNIEHLVMYAGHTINQKGIVTLTLKARYSELQNTVRLMQFLNNDINILAKLPGVKRPVVIGCFKIKSINIDGDGCSRIKLFGVAESIETDNLNAMPSSNDDVQEFRIRCTAEIEEEEEGDE